MPVQVSGRDLRWHWGRRFFARRRVTLLPAEPGLPVAATVTVFHAPGGGFTVAAHWPCADDPAMSHGIAPGGRTFSSIGDAVGDVHHKITEES